MFKTTLKINATIALDLHHTINWPLIKMWRININPTICFTTFQNTWNWQKSIINWLNIWLCVFTCLGNFFDNTKFPYNEVVRTWYLEKCWYALNVWKFFNCNSLIIQHKTSCFIFGCSFGNMYTSNCNHYFYFVHLTFF
jgi:hypothetical protein